ncbi:Fasciclin-like arabinogalactan [Musa troglodytarum]|uniref:Fasciclin-like arabinogalactan n=3 Tax=Musa troglodytarum TaxID=320322 RepID=A0A9E7GWF5_9LILI|nr:Fasciclin-like arabinogalactan [Musa troglodytarum]
MASRPQLPLLLVLLSFLILLSSATAHNITRLLSQFPDFSNFNSLLSQADIASEVNRRQTITVLAVDNSAASSLSSLDSDTLKQVLSIHVVLDYYDEEKIHNLRRRSTLFTTLFQTTGVAANRMGFLNATKMSDGRLAFGSGVPGSPLVATYVKSVASKPYNLSVLQISAAIVPQGINGTPLAPFGAPITAPPEVPAPAPVDDSTADGPAEAPEASAPEPAADAPEADAPDADSPAAGPAADGDAPSPAEEEEDQKSAAGPVAGGISVGLAMAALFLAV